MLGTFAIFAWLTIFSLREKATIHQAPTMLVTSKKVLFPGHNHLLTTGAEDPTPYSSPERQRGW